MMMLAFIQGIALGPLLLSTALYIGGEKLVSALLDYWHPVSAGEEALLKLKQKGEREQFDRENQATRSLMQEDANSKWLQMMTQLGMAQASQGLESGTQAIVNKSENEMQATASRLPYAMGLEGSELAAAMEQPMSAVRALGLPSAYLPQSGSSSTLR